MDADGNLFGTASKGGSNSDGTIFELAKTTAGYAAAAIPLVTLTPDNGTPQGSLIMDAAGTLFGTTASGGVNNDGTVFEIVKTATGYANSATTLVSFNNSNGFAPHGSLLMDAAGDLFGTTGGGGANKDGTVFEIAKTANGYAGTPTTLVSFSGGNSGDLPYGSLIADANGDLFGTTFGGGGSGHSGTVFEIVKTASGYASTPTVLAAFSTGGGSGYFLYGSLILDAAGDLFGTAADGGTTPGSALAPGGTVFEIVKTATGYDGTPRILVNFDDANGYHPSGSLIANAEGDLFGTTQGSGVSEDGTIFEITGSGFNISGMPPASLSATAAVSAWKGGQLSAPASIVDTAGTIQADLDSLQAIAASGQLAVITLSDSGIPSLSVTAAQLSSDASAIKDIAGFFTLSETAPTTSASIAGAANSLGNMVVFSGASSQFTITPSGDGAHFTVGAIGITDILSNIQALQFNDVTLIVARTPGSADAPTTGNITELYGAVFNRLPDVPGLAYYQSMLAANPGTPLTAFAQDFLASPEYLNNSAHNYAQNAAGDATFVTDLYNNLLHRTPEAGATAWYETNVVAPLLGSITPGTAAYSSALALAHASVVTDFSQSAEFLGDVQVTAQNAASNRHWLVLI